MAWPLIVAGRLCLSPTPGELANVSMARPLAETATAQEALVAEAYGAQSRKN